MSNQNRIMVIGGAGFVGSNLCEKLLFDENNHITVVDNLLSAEADNLPKSKRLDFVYGSIADDRILHKIGKEFDFVYHLATYHGNQSSIADPIADHENNTITTLKICEHFKGSNRLKKMVYASAGCTVARKTFESSEATSEEAPVSLYHDSPYQISKIVGEFYGNYYWKQYQLPFVKARFQNVYGPKEILGAGRWRGTSATIWRNVIPTFVWKALHHESLPLDKGGIATRDFIFVEDIVEGLIACALKGESGEVYNLASGQETSIKNLAEMINHLCDNKTASEMKEARNWDRSGMRFGSTDKSFEKLGFKAKYTLEKGLEKTINWTKQNCEKIANAINRHQYFVLQD